MLTDDELKVLSGSAASMDAMGVVSPWTGLVSEVKVLRGYLRAIVRGGSAAPMHDWCYLVDDRPTFEAIQAWDEQDREGNP